MAVRIDLDGHLGPFQSNDSLCDSFILRFYDPLLLFLHFLRQCQVLFILLCATFFYCHFCNKWCVVLQAMVVKINTMKPLVGKKNRKKRNRKAFRIKMNT